MDATGGDARLDAWKASTVGTMLAWQLVLSLPAAVGLTFATISRPGYLWVVVAGWSLMAVLLALALATRLPWRVRAYGLLAVFLGMVLVSVSGLAPGPVGFTYGTALVALAGLLLGGPTAVAAAAVVLAVFLAAALAAASGSVVPRPRLPLAQEWISAISGASAPFVAVLIGIRRLFDRTSQAHADAVRALRELEATRERLVASEKAELVGRLAGGVAHDLNNTLTVIMAHADDLRSGGAGAAQVEVGTQILEVTRSAAHLAQQLLAAARRGVAQPRSVDLAATARDAARAIRRVLPHDVTLEVDAAGPLFTRVDPGQIHQVVLNLALNARDAMPDGGRITVSVRAGPAPPGGEPRAVLEVTDTGVGMDESTRARAFEPFFTTKEPGKGTGLGLANVREVVEQAGGSVSLRSSPGAGTTFTLAFPSVAPDEAAEPLAAPGDPQIRARVLVVDDDIRVRAVIVTALSEAGHEVEEAGHVDAALRIVESVGELDLLVTDLVMPGPPVATLIGAFQERFPRAGVLACSAYSDDPEVRRSVFTGELRLLAKPFERGELLAAVQGLLRGEPKHAVNA